MKVKATASKFPLSRPNRRRKPAAARTPSLRREFRAWRDSLPAGLERDPLLMPDVIAETVVAEVKRCLPAQQPEGSHQLLRIMLNASPPGHIDFTPATGIFINP